VSISNPSRRAATANAAPKTGAAPKIYTRVTAQTQRKRRVPWFWVTSGLIGASMLSATAGALLAVSLASTPLLQRQLSADEAAAFSNQESIASSSAVMPELNRPVNILVMGIKVLTSDLNDPPSTAAQDGYLKTLNSVEGLSDTMLLLRFDPETRRMVAMSIPRDTRTEVTGLGMAKINAANVEGGPALSARTVSGLLGGVGIDRYVRINVQGVEKLIDALGGVKVNIAKDMKYQDDSQHLYINLKAGEQRLSGSQAQQYLRFRYDENGDIGRIQRQQSFMRALVEQTLNPVTLAKLPNMLSIVRSHLDTNLTVEELFALANFATRTQRSKVEMLMVPGRFSAPEEFDASYWVPDLTRISTMMSQHFGVPQAFDAAIAPEAGPLRVAIQNGTDADANVSTMASKLAQGGYSNVVTSSDLRQPIPVTRIIAQQGDGAGAEAIRKVLGLGEVRIESTGDLESDITVQIGQDWAKTNR
jgi:polyisoprenyl-teichoic acid--peptidoglycan teichoic acid transferase